MYERIERILENSSASTPFYSRYALLKDHLFREYEHWAAGFRHGNNHGRSHIERVLEKLDQLLGEDFLPNVISPYELFLSMMAILYHDDGILRDRKDHADISGKFLDEDPNTYVINELDKEIIRAAVVSHPSSKDIKEQCAKFSPIENIGPHKARPSVVAALVRLADELDEDHRRADPVVASKIQILEESKFFWEFCQRVLAVRPDPKTLDINIGVRFKPEDVGLKVKLNDELRLFISAFAEKLAKINKERAYLSAFLPESLRYRKLVISVRPLPEDPQWKNPRDFTFDENKSAAAFVQNFPELLAEPARKSINVIHEAIRTNDLDSARSGLLSLEAVLQDLPSDVRLSTLWDLAIVYSLKAKQHSENSETRLQGLREAVEYLKRWYELGKSAAWQELQSNANIEIYKIACDKEMEFLFSTERKSIEKMLGADAKCLIHTWGGGSGGCLPAGVLIDVPGGSIPIEQLQAGMTILSSDLQGPTRKIETKVVRTYRFTESGCVRINGRFRMTQSQPLYLGDGRWTKAGQLVLGSKIQTGNGDPILVTQLENEQNSGEVYSLTTDHATHNFLVSGLICGNLYRK